MKRVHNLQYECASELLSRFTWLPSELWMIVISQMNSLMLGDFHRTLLETRNIACVCTSSALATSMWMQKLEHVKFDHWYESEISILFSITMCRAKYLTSVISMSFGYWYKKHVTDNVLTSLAFHMSKLQVLQMSSQKNVTDASLEVIASRCPLLTTLDVSKCENIGDAGILAISRGCTKLSKLNFGRCEKITTGGIVASASYLSSLHNIDMTKTCENDEYVSRAVIALGTHCLQLQHVYFDGLCKNTDDAVFTIGDNCSHLETVSFGYNMKISDSSIINLVRKHKNLKHLCVCSTYLSDVSLENIGLHCRALEHLDIHYCKFSDMAMRNLAAACRLLKYLDVSCSKNVTDTTVIAFANACVNMQILNVCFCDAVTDESIVQVAYKCKSLEQLDLGYCVNVGKKSMDAITASCMNLREVNVCHCNVDERALFDLFQRDVIVTYIVNDCVRYKHKLSST